MLSFPNWMTFSTGILFFLSYGASVKAQVIPTSSSKSSQTNLESSELFTVPSKAADLIGPPPKPTSVRRVQKIPTLARSEISSRPQNISPPQQALSSLKSRSRPIPGLSISRAKKIQTLAQNLSPSQQTSPQITPQQPPQRSPEIAPGTQTPPVPVPQYINPNPNPLIFPTNPSEVDIRTVQPITLEQAVETAISNNEQIQQARLAVQRANAELREVRSIQYPTVNTNVDFSRISSAGTEQQRERTREATATELDTPFAEAQVNGQVELNYNVFSAGERPARISAARRQVRFQQLDLERVVEEIRFNATEAYYLLQRADAQVAIAQAAVEDASVSLRDARLLEQAGLGTRFSVLQAEVDLARANQDLTRAIADQRIARRRLAEVLNVGQRIELTAADEIQEAGTWPITLEETIVQAFKNRAELEQQVVQREISQQTSIAELASVKPQIDFIANYNFTDSFDDTVGVADGYSFAARMRWLIFDAGRAEARARQQYRNMDIANSEFARLRDNIRFEVEQAYYNLIASQENIQTANTNVITATESLRLARLRFQAGVGTQIDVINAQRDLTQARSDYLTAIIDYNRSLNTLQRQVSNWPDDHVFDVF